MSEISIKFRLTINDIIKFNNVVNKKKGNVLRFSSLIIFAVILLQNIMSEEKSYILIAFSIFLILFSFFAKNIVSTFNIKKVYKNYYGLRADTILEFYNDHIVEKNADDEAKIKYEVHIPLEAIRSVMETNEYYMFFISPLESIIIPKRILIGENTEKINNLIANVFSNRYEKRN